MQPEHVVSTSDFFIHKNPITKLYFIQKPEHNRLFAWFRYKCFQAPRIKILIDNPDVTQTFSWRVWSAKATKCSILTCMKKWKETKAVLWLGHNDQLNNFVFPENLLRGERKPRPVVTIVFRCLNKEGDQVNILQKFPGWILPDITNTNFAVAWSPAIHSLHFNKRHYFLAFCLGRWTEPTSSSWSTN